MPMKCATERKARILRTDGFTIIEVLAVLVVMAIVTTVILSRTPSIDKESDAEAAIIRSHLRFAQALAMAQPTERWGIAFTPTAYTLVMNGLPAGIRFPDGNSATRNLPDGLRITTGIGSVLFDSWGSPGNETVTLTVNHVPITIAGVTGFIP